LTSSPLTWPILVLKLFLLTSWYLRLSGRMIVSVFRRLPSPMSWTPHKQRCARSVCLLHVHVFALNDHWSQWSVATDWISHVDPRTRSLWKGLHGRYHKCMLIYMYVSMLCWLQTVEALAAHRPVSYAGYGLNNNFTCI